VAVSLGGGDVSRWSLCLQASDTRRSETFRLLQAKNITRPQLKFKEVDKVDNSNVPFVPKIFIKPNATKPLPSCKCFYYCSMFRLLSLLKPHAHHFFVIIML